MSCPAATRPHLDEPDRHLIMSGKASPALSASSNGSKGRRTPSLTLDLSDLPPLIQPSPPSNTLLITNLQEPSIFHPQNLQTLRQLIESTSSVHTWAPLPSFRRIVVTFYNVDDSVALRQKLDGEVILGERVRVYFGENTPLNPTDQHLQAPKSDKLFFISPPPSPPHGWMMRNEEPPNKEVHAEDLATALSKLHARPQAHQLPSPVDEMKQRSSEGRQRSGSTIVYHPEDYGDSPDLPAIAVEDTTGSPVDVSPMDGVESQFQRTSRPPVELMADS